VGKKTKRVKKIGTYPLAASPFATRSKIPMGTDFEKYLLGAIANHNMNSHSMNTLSLVSEDMEGDFHAVRKVKNRQKTGTGILLVHWRASGVAPASSPPLALCHICSPLSFSVSLKVWLAGKKPNTICLGGGASPTGLQGRGGLYSRPLVYKHFWSGGTCGFFASNPGTALKSEYYKLPFFVAAFVGHPVPRQRVFIVFPFPRPRGAPVSALGRTLQKVCSADPLLVLVSVFGLMVFHVYCRGIDGWGTKQVMGAYWAGLFADPGNAARLPCRPPHKNYSSPCFSL